MALDFPSNPVDGQYYPDPPQPGVTQYQWSSDKQTWLTVFAGITRVTGKTPITVTGSPSEPVVGIQPATTSQDGYMSAADKRKLNELTPASGTVTQVTAGTGLGAPQTGQSITTTGTIQLLPPTPTTIGGVKNGTGVEVLSDGSLSLKPPSSINIGGVKQGAGISISADGTISLAAGGGFVVLDNISASFNGSVTTFQMTTSGVPYAPSSANSLLIFLGGVIQIPNNSFSVTGPSLVFTAPPPAGTSFYGISLS